MSKTNAHRDPSVRAARRVRRGLLPLLLHARDAVRTGRQLLVRVHGRAPQRRPRERARQPRQPRARDARVQLRRRRPRAAVGGAESDLPVGGGRGRRPLPRPHARRRALAGAWRGRGRSWRAPTTTWSRRSPGSSRRTRRAARRARRASCTPAPKPSGSSRPDLPDHAARRQRLWAQLGSRGLEDQRLPAMPRSGAASRPGTVTTKGETPLPPAGAE